MLENTAQACSGAIWALENTAQVCSGLRSHLVARKHCTSLLRSHLGWKIFCIEELVFRTSTKNMNFIIFDGLQKCVEFMTKSLVSKLSVSRIRFFYIFCSCWTPGGISIGIKLVLFAMGMCSNVFGSAQDLTITSASNAFSSMPWWIEKQL